MKDLKRIREELTTILLFLLTLAFTSSNLTPEILEDNSISRRLPKVAVIN